MLLAGLLDEGAGDLDSQAFQQALDEKAIEISFRNDRDHLGGRMRTLVKNLDRAGRAPAPRRQCAALRRGAVRAGARARQRAAAPRRQRSRLGRRARLAGERLRRPSLRAAGRRHARDAGARSSAPTSSPRRGGRSRATSWSSRSSARSTRDGAAELVDKAFADLPAKGDLTPVAEAPFAGLGKVDVDPARRAAVDHPLRPARAQARRSRFHRRASSRAHVLGGSGNMTSRLFREVREKRGLAYTVFGNFYALDHGGFYYGGTTTKNERAREILRRRLGRDPRRGAERPRARRSSRRARPILIGSYPLRFDTSVKIAAPARPDPARRPRARLARRAQPRRSPR